MSPRAIFTAIVAMTAPAVLGMGCEAPGVTASDGGAYTPYAPDASEAASGNDATTEAAGADTSKGSPLCNATTLTGCYPDDPSSATPDACMLPTDGGMYSCHVQQTSGGRGVQPTCTAAGTVLEGMSCQQTKDCAAGFECVGNGTCQHYCCSGDSICSTAQFCDIQSTVGTASVKVPVCMPIRPYNGCQLLKDVSCPPTETCAVVRDDGSTSCVAVGDAKAGDSCDSEHCGAGLVCLGPSGDRYCYRLCHTATPAIDCAATPHLTCKGGLPLFPDPAIGVCQ